MRYSYLLFALTYPGTIRHLFSRFPLAGAEFGMRAAVYLS